MQRKVFVFLVYLLLLSATLVLGQESWRGEFACKREFNFLEYITYISDIMGTGLNSSPCYVCHGTKRTANPKVPAPVPRTGQTTSYMLTDDGYLQGGVEWPNPRFIDNGDGTVTDNLTGLVWLKNASCIGMRTWYRALVWDCKRLATGLCGLTDNSIPGDWRLPNIEELLSLVDRGQFSPALPSENPFTGVQASYYWSSTTSVSNTRFAWYLWFEDGFSDFDPKSSMHYVWPVRGGQ